MFPLNCISFLFLVGGAFGDVASSFKQANIVPNPITTAPQTLLGVEYDDGTIVYLGTNLTSRQVVNSPTNYYVADPNSYFNLILLDIDAPSAGQQIYVWGVGNIRGSDVSSGMQLAPYQSPTVSPTSPPHRLVMMLYQQPGYIVYDLEDLKQANGRVFDVAAFGKKHNFIGPLFGNFFYLSSDL